jgi:hypothetical protein
VSREFDSDELDDDPRPELTRRMAEVWRSQRPTEMDVARARRRLALGRVAARRRPRVQPLAWIFAGVFGAGSVLAAGGLVVQPWLASRESKELAPAASALEPAVPRRSRARAEVRQESAPQGAPSAATPDMKARPPLAAPVAQKLASPASVAAEERTVSGAWARAAAALRQGETGAAERALADVMAMGDAAERDAAALLQAQLWVQSGQGERAVPRLRELAESAATPSIRRQASELLRREP